MVRLIVDGTRNYNFNVVATYSVWESLLNEVEMFKAKLPKNSLANQKRSRRFF
jgi:hypothetical protein